MDVLDRIREQVESNPVVLYMKGTPQFPMCGFSSRAAEALKRCGVEFAYVNVLADPRSSKICPASPIGRRFRSCISAASWSADATSRSSCTKKASSSR